MFKLCAVYVVTCGNTQLLPLTSFTQLSSGKMIVAVGEPLGGTGGGVGVAIVAEVTVEVGDCADATDITAKLRLIPQR